MSVERTIDTGYSFYRVLLTTLLILFSCARYYDTMVSSVLPAECGDFAAVYAGIKNMSSGVSPYSASGGTFYTGKSFLTTTYNYLPFYGTMLWFFNNFEYRTARYLWIFFNQFFLGVLLYLLFRLLRVYKKNADFFDFAILFALLFNFHPLITGLTMGQNHILLLVIFLSMFLAALSGRDFIAGIVLALLILIKINFGFFLVFFLLKKRWKILWGTCVGCVLGVIGSCLLVSPQFYLDFFSDMLRRIERNKVIFYDPNTQALSSFLVRVFWSNEYGSIFSLPFWFVKLLVTVSCLCVCGVTFFLVSLRRTILSRQVRDFLECSYVLFCVLLVSPYAWRHYFFWLLFLFPVGFYIFRGTGNPDKTTFLVLFFGYSFVAVNPFYLLVDFLKDILGPEMFYSSAIMAKPWTLLLDYGYFYILGMLWLYFSFFLFHARDRNR